MTASLTPLPVIGVPIKSRNSIDGWDSVLSIFKCPRACLWPRWRWMAGRTPAFWPPKSSAPPTTHSARASPHSRKVSRTRSWGRLTRWNLTTPSDVHPRDVSAFRTSMPRSCTDACSAALRPARLPLSARSMAGKVNLAPFSYFNVFSANPPMVIFSPARRGRDATTKHTWDNVQEVGEVVVNLVDHALVHACSLASTDFAEGVDEFVKAGLTPVPSEAVQPPRVGESPVQLECKVMKLESLGDQGGAGQLGVCRNRAHALPRGRFERDRRARRNQTRPGRTLWRGALRSCPRRRVVHGAQAPLASWAWGSTPCRRTFAQAAC